MNKADEKITKKYTKRAKKKVKNLNIVFCDYPVYRQEICKTTVDYVYKDRQTGALIKDTKDFRFYDAADAFYHQCWNTIARLNIVRTN